jgi:GNAT superfamily N-acetyltransferase
MQDHECLIDFVAVSPEARGKGVGAKLMCWAEDAGTAILAETQGAAVAALGVDMTLWVRGTLGNAKPHIGYTWCLCLRPIPYSRQHSRSKAVAPACHQEA